MSVFKPCRPGRQRGRLSVCCKWPVTDWKCFYGSQAHGRAGRFEAGPGQGFVEPLPPHRQDVTGPSACRRLWQTLFLRKAQRHVLSCSTLFQDPGCGVYSILEVTLFPRSLLKFSWSGGTCLPSLLPVISATFTTGRQMMQVHSSAMT